MSLFAIWAGVNAFADCPTKYYAITTSSAPLTVNSPNYPPYGFPTPGGCQFTVAAPIYHEIVASCLVYIGVKLHLLRTISLVIFRSEIILNLFRTQIIVFHVMRFTLKSMVHPIWTNQMCFIAVEQTKCINLYRPSIQ